jgi:IS605 OrfB family transposase
MSIITTSAFVSDQSVTGRLNQFADLYGKISRRLFVDLSIKKLHLNDLKSAYIIKYGITARQFNSIRIDVEGRTRSVIELKKEELASKKRKLLSYEKRLIKVEKKLATAKKLRLKGKVTQSQKQNKHLLHQFKRKIASLKRSLILVEEQIKKPNICFGSKALFREQFNLEQNNHTSHEAWKREFDLARSSGIFVVGSKDESHGNQTCQFTDGKLKLRLPNSMLDNQTKEKTISIPIDFKRFGEELITATSGDKNLGSAVAYRFVREERGWYVHATFDMMMPEIVSSKHAGAIGIDLNKDHFAVAHVSHDGNLVKSWKIPFNNYKRTASQNEAALGDVISNVIHSSKAQNIPLPIAIEKLDFRKKKDELRSRGMNRMLSNLTYSKFHQIIESKCKREGIELIRINPAYTSVIGEEKFAEGYGLSVHQAAAMAIARRSLNLGEKLCRKAKDQLRFPLPARNRGKHVWSDWGFLSRVAKTERFRARAGRRSPSDLSCSEISSPPKIDILSKLATGEVMPKGA